MRVSVVGAGVAGLTAGGILAAAGHEVVVHEASGRVGGRLWSARLHGTVVDLGAPYLTIRDPGFGAALQPLLDDGSLVVWAEQIPYLESGRIHRGFGHPEARYVAPSGMDVIAQRLAAPLDVRLHAPVSDVAGLGADMVVVALPAPRARELVGPAVPVVTMTPCLAWAAGYGEAPPPDWPGMFVNGDPILQWLAVDSSKGRGPETVLVAHLADGVRPEEGQVAEAVADVVGPWARRPRWTAIRWWEHARVPEPLTEGALRISERVVVAGDWCAGSRVEGAYLSGVAAAHMVGEPDGRVAPYGRA